MSMTRLLAPLLLLSACVVGASGDDYDDGTWTQTDADDDAPAAIDEGPATEDMPDLVDDAPDAAELDGDLDAEDGAPLSIAAAAPQVRNPLGPSCADPGVIRVDDASGRTFWAACTGNGFPLYKSKDLVHWKAAGHVFTAATKPAWGGGNWWAPEIHQVGTGFVAYFSALSPSRGKMCIGAAHAQTMAGPWQDIGHPLVCDPHVSLIDASFFHDAATNRNYLLYKTDGNGLHPQEKTVLYARQLDAAGTGFVGVRHALLKNTLAWEGDVVEGPWMIHRGGFYYLFYSGFRYCNATYGTGVARARSPLGPFTKKSAPILRSNGTWGGPGHNSVVRTGGRGYLVYHAWKAPHACGDSGGRQLMLDPITWKGGWPVIGNGTPSTGAFAAPVVP